MTGQDRTAFEKDPAGYLEDAIKTYAANAPGNRLPDFGNIAIFDEPLVGFASGDDLLFQEYKLIIGEYHLTPREIMELHCDLPKSEPVSVICLVLPIIRETRLANRKQTEYTSPLWNHTTGRGQAFVDEITRYTVSLLEGLGFQAVGPEVSWLYTSVLTRAGHSINFSHRHACYAAGMGTFGLHDNFISQKGAAMRCSTVVTNALLPPGTRTYDYHYGACLFYQDGSCKACIKRCPAGAITEQGRDNEKCRRHRALQNKMIRALGDNAGYMKRTGATELSYGCGLCATKVPCEDRVPPLPKAKTH